MTVTKADILNRLEDATGIGKIEIDAIVNGFLHQIIESLQDGDRIEIRGFGSFHSKERDPRKVKNPQTRKVVSLDRRFVPVFRPAKYFRESVNESLLKQSTGGENVDNG